MQHFMRSTICVNLLLLMLNGTKNESPYLQTTGRFGLSIEEEEEFSHCLINRQTFKRVSKRRENISHWNRRIYVCSDANCIADGF